MKRLISAFILLLVLPWLPAKAISSPDLAPGNTDWSLQYSADKLQVFTRPEQNSDVESFMAESRLNAPLASILAVIADPSTCPGWVDGCIKSLSLGGKNFNDRFGYALNHIPWPFKNRDVVVRITTNGIPANESSGVQVSIEMKTSPDNPNFEQADTLRIEHSQARYILEETTSSTTSFTWLQHTEPAGALPAWLVNTKLIDLPRNSIPKLEQMASQDKYRNAKLIWNSTSELIDVQLATGQRVSTLYNNAAH